MAKQRAKTYKKCAGIPMGVFVERFLSRSGNSECSDPKIHLERSKTSADDRWYFSVRYVPGQAQSSSAIESQVEFPRRRREKIGFLTGSACIPSPYLGVLNGRSVG